MQNSIVIDSIVLQIISSDYLATNNYYFVCCFQYVKELSQISGLLNDCADSVLQFSVADDEDVIFVATHY